MPKPTFAQRLEALASLREPTRLRLYRYVERQLEGVSRDQAADAVGISRAMAAFHLDRLTELGLLRAAYRRLSGRAGRGAGRPSKLYRRSRREFRIALPARDHELLARVLAESVAGVPPGSAIDEAAHGFGRALGRRARGHLVASASPKRLVGCVEDVLEEIGFEPIPTGSGDVRARNCPFDPLSRSFPGVVCGVAHAIVRGVIDGVASDGTTVRRDPQPDRCCVVLVPKPRAGSPGPTPSKTVRHV